MQVLRLNVLSRGFTYQLQCLTSSARQKKRMYCAYISIFRVVPTTAGNVFFFFVFQPVVAVQGVYTRTLFRAKGKVTGTHWNSKSYEILIECDIVKWIERSIFLLRPLYMIKQKRMLDDFSFYNAKGLSESFFQCFQ